MTTVIGIDGGGTHTRAVLVDTSGTQFTEVARASGPGSNPSAIGWDAAARIIRSLINDLLEASGNGAGEITAAGIGLAGAPGDRHADALRAMLQPVLPGARLALSSDLEIALTGAHGQRLGIMLLSGTGSGAFGVNTAGKSVRVGGWGYLIGDEGSGYDLGRRGLAAVMHAYDGRAAPTQLTDALLHALDLPEPEALIAWLYGQPVTSSRVAALAPVVLGTAADGDPAARAIIEAAAAGLLALAQAAFLRLGAEPLRLALRGGLLSADNILAQTVQQRLQEHLPQLKVVESQYAPVMGAALLALEKFTAP